jgi:hypothetical protein
LLSGDNHNFLKLAVDLFSQRTELIQKEITRRIRNTIPCCSRNIEGNGDIWPGGE